MSATQNIELLLLENVDNLGIVGDIVQVKPGYARNYLLPHGLATTPSEGAIKAVEERRAEVERELKALREKLEATLAKLEGFELTMQRSHNDEGVLYGSVSQHDIALALQEEGFDEISDREVRIGDQIKHLDSYDIPIQLDKDLKTEIKLWVVSDRPADQQDVDPVEAAVAEHDAADADEGAEEEATESA